MIAVQEKSHKVDAARVKMNLVLPLAVAEGESATPPVHIHTHVLTGTPASQHTFYCELIPKSKSCFAG